MSEFSTITDVGDDRGLCRGCQWWQAEHEGPSHGTVGLCMHPELTHFSLQVSGHSGCNRFLAGVPVGAESAANTHEI